MRLRFGAFVFDDEARLLTRDGEPVSLTPKAFELLAYLVERRPRAVNKAQIHDRIWPATFVAEVNLHALVNELRRAFGDNARQARFVRTVRGFGYAFCAEATVAGAAAAGPAAAAGATALRLIWRDRELALLPGENSLGRTREASLWIDHGSVSRQHAVIGVDGDVAEIEDCGSKNGTFVNDARIEARTRLQDGDTIRLGRAELLFRAFPAEEGTETVSGS